MNLEFYILFCSFDFVFLISTQKETFLSLNCFLLFLLFPLSFLFFWNTWNFINDTKGNGKYLECLFFILIFKYYATSEKIKVYLYMRGKPLTSHFKVAISFKRNIVGTIWDLISKGKNNTRWFNRYKKITFCAAFN